MWSQLVRVGLLLTAALAVAVPAVQYLRTVPAYHLYAAGMLTLAEAKLAIGYEPDSGQMLVLENGGRAVSTLEEIVGYAPWHAARDNVLETVRSGMWLGVKIGLGVVAVMLAWFRFQGRRLKRKKRVRGAELVTAQGAEPAGGTAVAGHRTTVFRRARALPHRGRPLSRAHRNAAYHRVGHHGIGQDRADLRPGGTDPPARRALRDLRQDGQLHEGVLRSRQGRAAESAGRPRPRAGRRSSRRDPPGIST